MIYRTLHSELVGDPGLFGSIGRFIGRVAGPVARVIPGAGAIGTAVGIGRSLIGGGGRTPRVPTLAETGAQGPGSGAQSAVLRAQLKRYGTGKQRGPKDYERKGKGRRMNFGNAKAARRSIRRIKGVRKLLQSIERELPKRKATGGGSPGVITRSEAARALRR